MKLALILAPYDSGHYHAGFGQGPDAIITGGLVDELALHGHEAEVIEIDRIEDEDLREITAGFAVCDAVSRAIGIARAEGRFPIVLAGNCLTAAGAVAGEGSDSIVWFDQHGDINTPETSSTGFLDGMALATVLGLCWRTIANAIPGFSAIDPWRCMLVGARDLDTTEKKLLEDLPVIRASCTDLPEKAERLKAAGAERAHLHIDLDVHNSDTLQANRYAAPGGPSPQDVRQAVSALARSVPVTGVTITAYDPAFDAKGEVPPVVGGLLVDFLAAMERI